MVRHFTVMEKNEFVGDLEGLARLAPVSGNSFAHVSMEEKLFLAS